MEWALILILIYFIIGEAVAKYYTRKKMNNPKLSDKIAADELLISFLWLPFLFLLVISSMLEKIKIAKKEKQELQTAYPKSASLKDSCEGPMSLCNAVKNNCSECQSINQQNALEKMYGKEIKK